MSSTRRACCEGGRAERSQRGRHIMVCERGPHFGYTNLVSDMRSLPSCVIQACPVVLTQPIQCSARWAGSSSGGQREFVLCLRVQHIASGVAGVSWKPSKPFGGAVGRSQRMAAASIEGTAGNLENGSTDAVNARVFAENLVLSRDATQEVKRKHECIVDVIAGDSGLPREPTVEADVLLESGVLGRAASPSAHRRAVVRRSRAARRRQERYGWQRRAAGDRAHQHEISEAILGRRWPRSKASIDRTLIDLEVLKTSRGSAPCHSSRYPWRSPKPRPRILVCRCTGTGGAGAMAMPVR